MGQQEGPVLGLVVAISSVFNPNPIPTAVNLEDVFGFSRPRTSASTLLEWLAHTVPNKPSSGGHCNGRAEKGCMLSPHNFTSQNLP